MNRSVFAMLLLAGVAAGSAAEAAETGVYLGLSVGAAKLGTTDIQYYDQGGTFGGSGATDTADGRFAFKAATEFRGTIGYDFGRVRADLEIGYARSTLKSLTIDRINGAAVTLTPGDVADVCDYLEVDGCSATGNTISFDGGRLRQLSAIGSVWLDLPIGKSITPYVGGGAGVAGFETDGEGKARFGWQLGAGVAFNVSASTAVTIDYRYRQANGTRIEYDESSGFNIGKLKTSSVSAGLRFTF